MKSGSLCNSILRGPLVALSLLALTGSNGVAQTSDAHPSVATSSEAAPNDLKAPPRETADKLVAAIQQGQLWQRLSHFQTIADQHPDRDGHGNRDTGTSGYKASVNYVANLMRRAGYKVTIQTYSYRTPRLVGVPTLTLSGRDYPVEKDWVMARLSGGGDVTAHVRTVAGSGTGCSAEEFATFRRGDIALLRRGDCAYDAQVANAEHAGAAAVILYDTQLQPQAGVEDDRAIAGTTLQRPRLRHQANIPVIAVASPALGAGLLARNTADDSPVAHLQVRMEMNSGADYNVIADSPYGDPNHVVVVDAHLDSIYGPGMLDNASGSTTILEIALQMSGTPTLNQLRYIWFGGEELGLLGSAYYTTNLTQEERDLIVFDIDADVTATPNYDYEIADPRYAYNVNQFPPNVVPDSQIGNQFYADYFNSISVPSLPAPFGNYGTDSNSFSLIGIPNTGILTRQDCCKGSSEVALWGGYLGNYEGNIPSYDGGCVDRPNLWCDDLSNNDPAVLAVASKATAYAVFQLANYTFAPRK
jgi:hypothetical protein